MAMVMENAISCTGFAFAGCSCALMMEIGAQFGWLRMMYSMQSVATRRPCSGGKM